MIIGLSKVQLIRSVIMQVIENRVKNNLYSCFMPRAKKPSRRSFNAREGIERTPHNSRELAGKAKPRTGAFAVVSGTNEKSRTRQVVCNTLYGLSQTGNEILKSAWMCSFISSVTFISWAFESSKLLNSHQLIVNDHLSMRIINQATDLSTKLVNHQLNQWIRSLMIHYTVIQ